ncbi:hypothetical protein MASR2M117_24320 [Paludibacter sp.]
MGFFKLHKPLVYKYKPIYYDPTKEAKKERDKQSANSETPNQEGGSYQPKYLHKGVFREMADQNRDYRRKQSLQSNVRLVIIILILFLIAYFILK